MNSIASLHQRILSYLIDLSIYFLLPLFLIYSLSQSDNSLTILNRFSGYLIFLIFIYPIIYSIFISLLISKVGGTLGKIFTGTKIVSPSGDKISFGRAFFRNHIGYSISSVFLWLGFFWVSIDKERRAWHDQIANTYVISVNKLMSFLGLIIFLGILFFEFFIADTTFKNFRANSKLYLQILNEIVSLTDLQKTTTNTFSDKEFGFKLRYPQGWSVKKVYKYYNDKVMGVYFFPTSFDLGNRIDFSDEIRLSEYQDGYVNVFVSSSSDMFRNPEYRDKNYSTTKEFYDALKADEQLSIKKGKPPIVPGIPYYIGSPQKPFIQGAIEMSGVQTIGSSTPALMYWYLSGDRLYEFFIKYPKNLDLRDDFEDDLLLMTTSFETINSTQQLTKTNLSINKQLSGKLAFIKNSNLWFSNNGVEKQLTTDAVSEEIPYRSGLPKLWYSNPQISPDGKKIAYLKNTKISFKPLRVLLVSDIDGGNTKQLADDVEWMMPLIQWSSDSQQIYYPSSEEAGSIIIKSVNLISEKEKKKYGQFTINPNSNCGGGSNDIADHVSENENIISLGGGDIQVFALSPQNNFILHTLNCLGRGLSILDLSTKQDKKIDDKATRGVISPDGKSIAAISGNSIVIFDTNGNLLKTYQTLDTPQILLWDTTGKIIYYSSSKLAKNLDFDDDLALKILGSSPVSYKINISTLWKLTLDSGKSEKIIDFDAHNIKPVTVIANQKLLVVVVENAIDLYEYISQYKTFNNKIIQYYPKVKLVEVDLSSLTSTILANQVNQSSFLPQ